MDLNAALRWLNAAITENTGHVLREPEIVILKGTWRGLTYDQMASGSDYSTNYLMRDVAPKLWKQLSNVFGRSVGKTNFRVALEAYASSQVNRSEFDALNFTDSDTATTSSGREPNAYPSNAYPSNAYRESPEDSALEAGIYWHPAVLPETPESSEQGIESRSFAGETPSHTTGHTVHSRIHAISTATMYGYEEELAQVTQWVSESLVSSSVDESIVLSTERLSMDPSMGRSLGQPTGQLVGIWGLRGIGKTLLVEKLVAQVGDRFEGVVWRSLSSQPSLYELSASILTGLGIRVQEMGAIAQLLSVMTQKSLLIVLEGVEAILRADSLAGDYQGAYEDYGEFFQAAIGSRSCIVMTGIEGPADWVRQGGYSRRQSVRSLTLSRLSEAAATALLQAESRAIESVPPEQLPNQLSDFQADFQAGSQADSQADSQSNQWLAQWPELIARYQGHPLALKSALRVIREIFNGRVDEFLKQSSVLFTDILRLLAPSFERLSLSEVNILYWLASQEAPLSLAELQQTLLLPTNSATLISVLDSLNQRSLIAINTESTSPTFYPPALVKAYAVHQFMGRFRETPEGSNSRQLEPAGNRGANRTYKESFKESFLGQSAYGSPEQVIDLSPPVTSNVQLSQWFNQQFDADWQSLERLFEESARPAMRLRNAYHLQDETFVKRCKSVRLSADRSSTVTPQANLQATHTSAVLLVAIHQDAENLYKICVQAQPAKEATVLPEHLALKLLDTQQSVLATVVAQQNDSFVQLPYFRGSTHESFSIKLVLGDYHHTEAFVI